MNKLIIPEYSINQFVNRADEIETIRNIVQKIVEKEPLKKRTILIQAERGSGKTWLTLHLDRDILLNMPGVRRILIGFETPPGGVDNKENEIFLSGEEKVEENISSLIKFVAEKLKADRAAEPTHRELSKWIVDTVESWTDQVLVVLLDSIFAAKFELLEELEKLVFGPLAKLPNVIFIMTNRGKPYNWASAELRVDVEAIFLKNFGREYAKEQYRKLPENLKVNKNEDEIVDLSDGHTLSTVLYAQGADRTQVIDELLEVIGNKEEYESLRWYLEAMCVLKKFRENEMLFMIQAYSKTQDEAAQWKINDIRTQVRDRLIKTGLFYWEEGGYKIEDNLRRELRGFLKNDEPGNWKALNGAAFDLYKEWAEKFPRFRDHWEEQANAVQNA